MITFHLFFTSFSSFSTFHHTNKSLCFGCCYCYVGRTLSSVQHTYMQKGGSTAQQLSSGRDAKSSHNLFLSYHEKGKYTNCFLIYNNLQCVFFFLFFLHRKFPFSYIQSRVLVCVQYPHMVEIEYLSYLPVFSTNLLQFPLISCPISGFASLFDRLFLPYMMILYMFFLLTCITGLNSW